MLKKYCLDHLFDMLNINIKFNIINQFIKMEDKLQDEFKEILTMVLSKYTFNVEDTEGFACTDYTRELAEDKIPMFKAFWSLARCKCRSYVSLFTRSFHH